MTMQWIDAAGKRSPLIAKAGPYANPRLSPDGKRVALQVFEGGSSDIGIYDPQREAMTKLTFGGGISENPIWSRPDGRFIIFQKPGAGILAARADGAGQPQPLIEGKGVLVPWSMSPDGKRLVFFEVGVADAWVQTCEITEEGGALKAGKPARFFESKFGDGAPEFSPDGRWIAYASGQGEVVVRVFPPPAPGGQGGKWQVSTNGGTNPHWSRNSHELLYQSGDRIMAVSYTVDGDSFKADKPRVKIERGVGVYTPGSMTWDLAPDGRIAVLTPAQVPRHPA
jgi:serine/threonine-protein kinase